MTRPHPTTTHALFEHERVAEGYASARPFLHPQVFARARRTVGAEWPVPRALDVGCGTGLSSVALRDLAREVVGVDVSAPMLRRARSREGVTYVASSAEELPFRNGSFDLIVACGSIDWVDRGRFLPAAAALLADGGWLLPLDFGDAGRSPEVDGLERWHAEVLRPRLPSPPSADPMVTGEEASRCGLGAPRKHSFEIPCPFTAAQYADFLMTESSVIAAVEYGGVAAREIRDWLQGELRPLFGERPRAVMFEGYIQSLPKLGPGSVDAR